MRYFGSIGFRVVVQILSELCVRKALIPWQRVYVLLCDSHLEISGVLTLIPGLALERDLGCSALAGR
jgi:hypothetical protein